MLSEGVASANAQSLQGWVSGGGAALEQRSTVLRHHAALSVGQHDAQVHDAAPNSIATSFTFTIPMLCYNTLVVRVHTDQRKSDLAQH